MNGTGYAIGSLAGIGARIDWALRIENGSDKELREIKKVAECNQGRKLQV